MNEQEKKEVIEWQLSYGDKFRIICDKIGYDDLENWSTEYGYYRGYKCDMSEKDMIFSQEFMDKFWEYYTFNKFSSGSIISVMQNELLNNLDNPVEFLYNLINLGNTNTK